MTDLPLFYRTVVPLDRERHRTLALALPQRFDFARGSHVVPAVVDEFGAACRHLPIVFLPETLGPVPVFLTGLQPGRSALVDAQGAWIGRYLPAYLRRYPFILGEVEGAEPLICVDDTAPVFASAPAGGDPSPASPRPLPALPTGVVGLFDTASGDSVTLVERVRLVIDYAAAARRTEAFGRTLQDLALLRPLTIEGQDPASGARHALHGLTGVDEAALAGLSNAGIERLRAEGWLGSIHAHLVSLQAIGDFLRPFADPPASPVVGSDLVDAGLGAAA